MLTLFGAPGSGSAAIEAALVLCGADYRVVTAATWEADSALDELRRANPLQQIPTLVLADGSALSESAAILIHLGLAHPASNLLPADAAARAQAMRGLVFIAANCYAAIGVIDYPERWCADADAAATDNLRRGARARLHRYWDVFADTFGAPQPFFGGAAPGALDIHAAVVSRWSGARAHLKRMRPALHALVGRVDTHPTLAPVFTRHWPG
ncbi:MAG TPA: glutathione S-transferase [Burkholderiaceae bacterium]|nr:glutathione S-transferase [Burkholderiaceae bacterium]